MGRPSKTTAVLRQEGKSHRTDSELDYREKQEKALSTGRKLIESSEVKRDPVAHKKFGELKRLYSEINCDDALFSDEVNLYCKLYSECRYYESKQEKLKEDCVLLRMKYESGEIDEDEMLLRETAIENGISKYEIYIMKKRDMMHKIDKESLKTPASKQRSIPKKPPDKESGDDLMNAMLNRRGYNFVRRNESG